MEGTLPLSAFALLLFRITVITGSRQYFTFDPIFDWLRVNENSVLKKV